VLGRRKRLPPRVVLTRARRGPCVGIRVAYPDLPVACFAATRLVGAAEGRFLRGRRVFGCRVCKARRVRRKGPVPGRRGRESAVRVRPVRPVTRSPRSGGGYSGVEGVWCDEGDGYRVGRPHVHPDSSCGSDQSIGGKLTSGAVKSIGNSVTVGCHSGFSRMPGSGMSCATPLIVAHACQVSGRGKCGAPDRPVSTPKAAWGTRVSEARADREKAEKKKREKKNLHLCRVSHPSGTRYVNGCLSGGFRIPLQSRR
jgi:hypothetical protein